MRRIEQISSKKWQEWATENGATIIDVRGPGEWRVGILPGAVKIRLADIPARMSTLDTETKYLMVCRSGARSNQAAAFLAAQGYQAANLKGGMKALGLAS